MSQRALIAEDNAALRTVIEFTVARAGFDIVAVENGKKALQAAVDGEFDIIISDQQMPFLTGIEFCRELRKHEQRSETPFILLTAKKLELDIRQLKEELAISEVLAKPFSPQMLAALLCKLAAGVGC